MRVVFWIFFGAYVFALGLLLIGTFGLFGQEKDALSAVLLLPLGLPWNIIADRLGLSGAVNAILAPVVSLAILFWLMKR